MKTIKEYCIAKVDELIKYEQRPFGWQSNYDVHALLSIANFKAVNKEIPDKINRGHIIETILAEKYYQAYAEILFWGLIGMRPGSNMSKRTEIAKTALSHPEDQINNIFKTIKVGDAEGIKKLYLSLEQGGKEKIPEVDVSYFTKLLAFGSEAFEKDCTLLIYDKWTKLIHVHLLLEQGKNKFLDSLYTPKSLLKLWSKKAKAKSCSTDIIYPRKDKGYDAYIDYCRRMNALAVEISNDKKMEVKVFQLESFLFGHQLRGEKNKDESNPRYWIQQNYSKEYAPQIAAL